MVPLITLILFFVSMAILLFIFTPKILSKLCLIIKRLTLKKRGKQRASASSADSMIRYGVRVVARSKEGFNTEINLKEDFVQVCCTNAKTEELPLNEDILASSSKEEVKTEIACPMPGAMCSK